MYTLSFKHHGRSDTPQDIRRLRMENMDACRTMGQPVVWRHRFDVLDLENGYTLDLPEVGSQTFVTERCPACYDTVYAQPRSDCEVCYGNTIVSSMDVIEQASGVDLDAYVVREGTWSAPTTYSAGDIIRWDIEISPGSYQNAYWVALTDNPGATAPDLNINWFRVAETGDQFVGTDGYLTSTPTTVAVPAYRGFGPSVLTWAMEPDIPEEIFKVSEQGVLTRTQQAQGFAPWYPKMSDGDLMVNVELNPNDNSITESYERYLLGIVNPMTIRGFGRMTSNKRFTVGQSFQMAQLPKNHVLQGMSLE